MKFLLLLLPLLPLNLLSQSNRHLTAQVQQQYAKRVTIVRDNYGVPHIYGKTDADAAFGMMYAQCEDNYWQLEETFIHNLGRAAELYGEKELQADAYIKLFECVNRGKVSYANASRLIRNLCDAGAAAINYYLLKHPLVPRRLIQQYEPWFFLVPETTRPSSHGITAGEIKNAFRMD